MFANHYVRTYANMSMKVLCCVKYVCILKCCMIYCRDSEITFMDNTKLVAKCQAHLATLRLAWMFQTFITGFSMLFLTILCVKELC